MTEGYRPIPVQLKSGLVEVGSNIWTLEAGGSVYFRPPAQPRYPYPHRAVVIRLEDASLFVHSPISPTPEVRKDLEFEKTLSTNTPEPEWTGQIDQSVFGVNGVLPEIVFFHRESRIVIFADLIMDFDREIFSPVARITTRWNQLDRHTPRGVQLANTFGRASLRRSLEKVRAWEPKHLIVAHSPWLCVDGEKEISDLLDLAFDWLKPHPTIVEAAMTVARLLALLVLILPMHAVLVLVADSIYPRLRSWRSP
ncbi:MAG: hypothetical protein ACE5E4_08890 [Candidatus Binatia bacterium]